MSLSRLVAFCAAALLLAGCGGDPEPKFEDPTPSAAPTSASPTVEATPTPEPASAEEVVRKWVDAYNQLISTGDPSAANALAADGCRSCRELTEPLAQVYADGGRIDSTGWAIDALKVKQAAGPVEVDTAIVVGAGSTVPSAGADPVSFPVKKKIVTFRLERSGDGYLVAVILSRS